MRAPPTYFHRIWIEKEKNRRYGIYEFRFDFIPVAFSVVNLFVSAVFTSHAANAVTFSLKLTVTNACQTEEEEEKGIIFDLWKWCWRRERKITTTKIKKQTHTKYPKVARNLIKILLKNANHQNLAAFTI